MDTPFRSICEAAATAWAVPSLAVGTTTRNDSSVVTVGCDPDTVFRVASITKPFTAFLTLGLLELSATTGVWPVDVEVRHLLSHTSGFDCELPERDLSRFGDGDGALGAAIEELPTVPRLVGVAEVWSYANTGYWLAGHLAAVRAGATYEEAVTRRVVRPFGLESTSFGEPDLVGTGPDSAEGPYPRARRPSGGLVSTVGDILRFGMRLLGEPSFAHMRVAHGNPIGGVYGLGLFGERVGGVEVWGHTGSYDGFQTSLLLIPDAGAVFVGLTNSGYGAKALYEVENAFFDEVLGARRANPTFVDVPAVDLARYAGRYENVDASAEIRAAPGGLVLTADAEEIFLRPIGEGRFQVPDGPHVRERIDFPRQGFVRLGSRLAARVP
jgi:CubicO group peptidase (beta-lactamase class C family)